MLALAIPRQDQHQHMCFGVLLLVYLTLPGVVTVELVVAVVVVCSLSLDFVRRTRTIMYSIIHDIQQSAMQNVWE